MGSFSPAPGRNKLGGVRQGNQFFALKIDHARTLRKKVDKIFLRMARKQYRGLKLQPEFYPPLDLACFLRFSAI
jgi:hypothetical protein